MLNTRFMTILKELMTAEEPLTASYLAKLNQVTARTTREDIKRLSSFLSEHGAEIKSTMGKGYELKIHEDAPFRKMLQSISNKSTVAIPKTPEERIHYIMRRLLLSEDYMKMEDLADELYISKSTIQNDFKTVKNILKEYNLSLQSKPNYGMKLVGSELKMRFCMAEYIFDRKKIHLQNFSNTTIDKKEMDMIQQIILKQIKKHKILLSDIALNNLLIHIEIAFKRIKSGHYVTLYKTDVQSIKQQREYVVATEIAREVEKTFHIQFPTIEVAYIAIHLMGTKVVTNTTENVKEMIDDEIYDIVRFALDQIENELQLGIRFDQELIFGLSLHLKPAINRYKFGMNIRNPMLSDIKKNYPLAFSAAVIAGSAIGELTGTEIDENEIGYLALHIGAAIERKKMQSGPKRCIVVCASGFGTAQLIYYKLKAYFGNNLEVVGTTEYYNLHDMNLRDLDFIVSSIPIEESFSIPVIEVNAVLGEQDLKKIETFIVEKNQPLQHYFYREFMFLRQNFSTKEEVLQFLNDELMKKGLVDETFLESVYERENVAPTSFGNLVAIPHPITPKTEKTFMAVCTLEKPIEWSGKPVQLVCMLCVKKNSQEDLQEMYNLMIHIIDHSEIVDKLIKAKSYETFMKILLEKELR
ncbi:BglG family transcription antiterminator [Fervidibacillus halotolerans]|uniref:BglG family transcription antiterminator n=1 Tax=Fervidibacillus halotolerans TaxID=2980027 RepID=A0A9E8RZS1_9BACI|nr:BglG family transcription antiterminator [Fervidibacillus halotolerans]WAA13439.1 BglG family transcription antiterminator [Fervidibacillus halotolerans]